MKENITVQDLSKEELLREKSKIKIRLKEEKKKLEAQSSIYSSYKAYDAELTDELIRRYKEN